MADALVLITGATGHLGFKVLRTALEAGYHVRAAVRSEQKATTLKSNHVLQTTPDFSNLSFIVVPDFLAPGAFDEAAKNTKYIIHVASPIVTKLPESNDYDAHFVQPAVQGTLGVFESARKAHTVRRTVVTSSVVAVLPLTAMSASSDLSYNADNRLPEIPPPFANGRVAYIASKIAALNRAEAWIAEEKPPFDVIHIHPSYNFGRDDLPDGTAYFQTGTNRFLLNTALGVESEARPNTWNDAGDTARMHVIALDGGKVAGNQSFLASSSGQDGMRFDQVKEIVARHFPEAVERGYLSNNGSTLDVLTALDISKTQEIFGLKPTTFKESVVGVIGHYLELLEKEKGSK